MKTAHEIARILLAEYFGDQPEHLRKQAEKPLAALAVGALRREARPYREHLQRLIRPIRDDLIPRAPPEVSAWLERTLTRPAFLDWALDALDPATIGISVEKFGLDVMDWFAGLSTAHQAEYIGAALRRKIGQTVKVDQDRRQSFTAALILKEKIMATTSPAQITQPIAFAPDTRGLPTILSDFDPDPTKAGPGWTAWYKAVTAGIANYGLALVPSTRRRSQRMAPLWA